MKTIAHFIETILLRFLFCGCIKDPEAIVFVKKISLDKSSLTMTEGESARLAATISPDNATNQKVIWSSSNPSAASVIDGLVSGNSPGSATITAKSDDGGKTAECQVTVNKRIYPLEGVSLDKSSLLLKEGEEYSLTATIKPDNATNMDVSWKSSDTSVATVSSSGKVSAIKAGSTIISITTSDGGKTATCEVTVIVPVQGISLNKSSLTLTEGGNETLIATITPSNATNKSVSWKSSNTSVATVDASGKITAVNEGFTIITVTTEDSGRTATCEVTVSLMDLSASETANCYIVSAPGNYKFKTVQGNTTASVGSVSSAEVLWETFGTTTAPEVGDLVRVIGCSNGYITINASGKKGNALIAAKDANGNILWSWHIWCTDKPSDQVYKNGAGILMDRNLGATSATPGDVGALGLLYQWGRKDPFLGSSSISSGTMAASTIIWPSSVESDSSTGTIAFATSHPTIFINHNNNSFDWYYSESFFSDDTRWNPNKGTYDPCPPGYTVPDRDCGKAFYSFLYDENYSLIAPWDSNNRGRDFTAFLISDSLCWYPAAGQMYNGSMYNVGTEGYYWLSTRSFLELHGYSAVSSCALGQTVRCMRK